MYGSQTGDPPITTTENGQAVAAPYSLLDGEATFAADPPWGSTSHDRTSTTLGGVGRGSASQFTTPTSRRPLRWRWASGVDALRMDVVAAPGAIADGDSDRRDGRPPPAPVGGRAFGLTRHAL